METAKVDVRKLQMLNDRINQTIDALHQVRLSVHGMSTNGTTTPFVNGTIPFAPNFAPNFAQNFGATAFPYGVPNVVPNFNNFGWTNPVQAQQLQQQLQQQLLHLYNLQQGYGTPFGQNIPTTFGTPFGNAYGTPFGNVGAIPFNGIPAAFGNVFGEPVVGNRIAQTFPFAQWGYSPLASGSWPSASQMS